MPRPNYQAKLAAAQRRREKVLERMAAAREALSYEDALIYLLTAHVEAGPGHALMPDPPLVSWAGRTNPVAPDCRRCGVTLASIAGKRPCPGDTRRCPALVEAESETTYRMGGEESGYRCGSGGSYADDFFSWTCVHGHETRLTAEGEHHRRLCSHDRSKGYRLEGCLGWCPARGLNVTFAKAVASVIEPKASGVCQCSSFPMAGGVADCPNHVPGAVPV